MVRKLTSADIPDAIRAVSLGISITYSEINFYLPQNDEHMIQSWVRLLDLGVGRGYLLEMDGAPRGIFLGTITPDTMSGWLHGFECVWGTFPEYRRYAVSLLKAFEKDCKEAGCKMIVCTAPESPKMAHMHRLYSLLGYVPRVQAFSKTL